MQTSFTWETDMFHCPLCMQLFAADAGARPECAPVIICKNIHTICRGCALRLHTTNSGDPPCPQCRTTVWKNETINRDRVDLMEKLELRCGSCENTQLMSNAAAVHHARECTGSHVECPMFIHDSGLASCLRNIKVSDVWDHCQQHHNDSKYVQSATPTDACDRGGGGEGESEGRVSFSFPFTLHNNATLYATATTARSTYPLCVHIVRRRAADGTDSIALCVRRFFPAVLLEPEPMLVSIEVGAYGGVVLHLAEMISCNDKLDDILGAASDQTFRQAVQLPLAALRQMHDNPNIAAALDDIEIVMSIQLRLRERSTEATVDGALCI